MSQNCTILCPTDEPKQVVAFLRDLFSGSADIHVAGEELNWSKIEIKTPAATLTMNRQVRTKRRGDSFSTMVLEMYTYFKRVKTSAEAVKKDVLDRVENTALAIGVVADPQFVEEAGHYDCIFGIGTALNATIWTGSGVINSDGKLLLDCEGNCDLA